MAAPPIGASSQVISSPLVVDAVAPASGVDGGDGVAVWDGLDNSGESVASGVYFAKLNVDENPQTAMQYDVMSIPTMILYQGGVAEARVRLTLAPSGA